MMTINQIAQAMQHIRIKDLSEDIEVSPYLLRKMRDADQTVPFVAFEKVSRYFEGTLERG